MGLPKNLMLIKQDPNRVDSLLAIKAYGDQAVNARNTIVNTEVTHYKNIQMTPDYSGERFGQIILTLLLTIIVTIPVLIMCGMAFLLQVFLVCMLIFAAIPLTMAVIPSFAPTAGNFFKKLIGLVLHKAALILVISVSLGITTIIYNATNLSSGLAGYMLMAFVVALINWGVFKYRLEILTLVTLGAIDRSDTAHRVIQNAGGSIQNTVSKGKEFITKRIKGSSARDSYSDENDSEQSSKPPRFYVVSGGKQNRSDNRSESGGGAGNQKVVNGGRQNSENRGEGEKSQYTISDWKNKNSSSRNENQTQNQEQKSNAVRSTSKNGIEQNQAKEQPIAVNETQNQIQRSTSREQNQATRTNTCF